MYEKEAEQLQTIIADSSMCHYSLCWCIYFQCGKYFPYVAGDPIVSNKVPYCL